MSSVCVCCVFFFNDTATTEIYTLSLHDALPIFTVKGQGLTPAAKRLTSCKNSGAVVSVESNSTASSTRPASDRKSTRLNSSHANISYAVFCLKKKKKNTNTISQSIQNQFTSSRS